MAAANITCCTGADAAAGRHSCSCCLPHGVSQEEGPPIAVVARALPPIVTSLLEAAPERTLTSNSLETGADAGQHQLPLPVPGMQSTVLSYTLN